MRFLTAVLILWSSFAVAQQKCDCEKEFSFIKGFIEKNYAGFSDKVTPSTQARYVSFSDSILKSSRTATATNYCYYTIQNWLNYFRDGHIQVMRKPKTVFSDSSEMISLSADEISALKGKPVNDIEGIYTSISKQYELAFVRKPNSYRDYAGVVITSKAKSWKPGQVKLELKETGNNTYTAIYYFKDHHPEVKTYTFKNGKSFPEDFIKAGVADPLPANTEPFNKLENSNTVVFYKDLDDSTSYLRVKSFDDHFAKKISSVLKDNDKKIRSKPYMIIDVRYNGGGSDFTYSAILPYIYTDPVKTVGADVLSTPDNIQSWQRVIDQNPGLPEEVKKSIASVIEQMKSNPGKLVSIAPDQVDSLPSVYPSPRKVAILIDAECGSSTEQFLLSAGQSKKVIIMGQHTAGVLDYSNMRTIDFPRMSYMLGYATSRSRRIPKDAIDNTGITPRITIDFNKPWIDEVKSSLRK
jgi:hypothetical protein